jgi:hypothetical protein
VTDYYVLGPGHTAWGPYNLSNARACALAFAHKHEGERSATIVGTVESVYSKHYDDELPPEPPENAPHPWE